MVVEANEKRKSRDRRVVFLIFLLVSAALIGHALLILSGLTSLEGGKEWSDYSRNDKYAENGTILARLDIDYNWLFTEHGEVSVKEDVRWAFQGSITLSDGSHNVSRRFIFHYYNTSNGRYSQAIFYDYEGSNDSNPLSVRFSGAIQFYRSGEYILRVDDDYLIDSNITFRGSRKIMVYDATYAIVEDMKDTTVASFEMTLGLTLFSLVILGREHFGLTTSLADVRNEVRAFLMSSYMGAYAFLLLLTGFYITFGVVSVSYGTHVPGQVFGMAYAGNLWLIMFGLFGLGLLVFQYRDTDIIVIRSISIEQSFLVYAAIIGSFSFVLISILPERLGNIQEILGDEPYLVSLTTMLLLSLIYTVSVVWIAKSRRKESLGNGSVSDQEDV